jgi:glycosyltransferase involved in cell wall biosynthesis
MNLPTLSMIVGTINRPTLQRTLLSIAQQERIPGDELIVIQDDPPHHDGGAWSKNEGMRRAKGDFILFMDDDDACTSRAYEIIRPKVAADPNAVHIFRMQRFYPFFDVLWKRRDLAKPADVSTQMFVVPNRQDKLAIWEPRIPRDSRLPNDFLFITQTISNLQAEVRWHTEVIASVWPARGNTWV